MSWQRSAYLTTDDRPVDCGMTMQKLCPFNDIGDRGLNDLCKQHSHTRCSGFVGWYDTYQCECGCHRSDRRSVAAGSAASEEKR